MKKSLPIKKSPSVPVGGKGVNGQMVQKTMPKAPKPTKGKNTMETSTRDAGPK